MQINLYEVELLEKLTHHEKIAEIRNARYPKPKRVKTKLAPAFISRKPETCCA